MDSGMSEAQVTADLLASLAQSTTAVSWDTLPRLVIQAMEAVERVKGLSGDKKKAVVVAGIQALIRKLGAANASMGASDPILLALVPTLVDRLVDVSKQGIQINVPAGVSGCCALQ
jgi:hypothetical protein